jgi:Na+-translocating ferredoxin:NAD+ oxidoreductase RnfA subunit
MKFHSWLRNSRKFPPRGTGHENSLYIYGILTVLCINSAIILHSWIIHKSLPIISALGSSKSKHSSTRLKTEIAAASVITSTSLALIADRYGEPLDQAIIHNVLRISILAVILQLCDSYIFLDRSQAI